MTRTPIHWKRCLAALAVSIIAVLSLAACSTSAAPDECLDAAESAGIPESLLEHIRNPGDLNALEKIALRKALEAAKLDDICGHLPLN